MTVEEMDNMFEVLYNNITSNNAPGLNAYEKSVFLTKAQDEIVKNYFNAKSKGNATQDGFDGSQKRQIDFSVLTAVKVYTNTASVPKAAVQTVSTIQDAEGNSIDIGDGSSGSSSGSIVVPPPVTIEDPFKEALFDPRSNSKSVELNDNIMMIINEMLQVSRVVGKDSDNKDITKKVLLQVVPIKFDEYSRLMSKPYKRPVKSQAWRLINSNKAKKADLIVGPSDTITNYTLRYIRRPKPIIVSDLDGLSIEGIETTQECELDPILHEEILQRAVELAKAAWTTTGQDNLQAMMQTGIRSE